MTHPTDTPDTPADTVGETVPVGPLDEALNQWRAELDADNSDLTSARQMCEESGLDTATLAGAVELVVEVWPSDPTNWPRKSSMLSPAEHLAMMIAGIGAELISGQPGDGRKLWRAYLHGPYRDEREAAFRALERDEGMGLAYLMHQLPAHDLQQQLVSEPLLDEARKIADNVRDAPQWVEVEGIGWVVFSQAV
jgi:hypothetical protein